MQVIDGGEGSENERKQLEADLRNVRICPAILFTFDTDGVYGHQMKGLEYAKKKKASS